MEEINALPIERCLLENLPQLLEHGATLLALLALQNCDFNSGNLSMDILNSVVFPPPYPGLPTEWLRNGTASPSSSSSDDGRLFFARRFKSGWSFLREHARTGERRQRPDGIVCSEFDEFIRSPLECVPSRFVRDVELIIIL